MLAGDWAHKRRVQQYGKTDYLSTVAQAEHSHRRDLLLLISSSYGLTFLTTQAPINTHDAAVSRYAAHAKRTKAHAPTWKHTCAHTLHTSTLSLIIWCWSLLFWRSYRILNSTWYYLHKQLRERSHVSNKACFHLGDNLLWRVVQSRDANLVFFLFRCCVSVFLKLPSHSCVCLYISQNAWKQPSECFGFHSAVGYTCTELVKPVEKERE